ncbi:hypothetical protein COS55_02140 [Candidatus Shapirobacteria bacterium CG03_land_8_20_14_0_80_40_19]|uniref:Regulatory protein RecX n=2 Tax=Candidatus Shapironibacteriota TaxID=1752721 RepID=A0A2M7BE44_9BACT|nr:MAG: hypothetical protein COS55_02140 [Candidatus Shapirobacteria bacterium CG03_land_8_20_14_0_80_40_19]PJC76685.1 MAG: hypothetical protein CO010_02225 [Candidatus Shapirobacteria bacterium CG_4_8_14_3_um_filter_39_11]
MEDISEYFDKVLSFLSYRARSEYEIDFYMLRKGWSEETKKAVKDKLKQLKLIDDEDFARQWISSRSNSRPAGKSQIKFELTKKGIDKEIISRLLAEERTSTAEGLMAEKLCQKRLERLKGLPLREKREKLFGLLARRGFSSQTAIGIIDKLIKKE